MKISWRIFWELYLHPRNWWPFGGNDKSVAPTVEPPSPENPDAPREKPTPPPAQVLSFAALAIPERLAEGVLEMDPPPEEGVDLYEAAFLEEWFGAHGAKLAEAGVTKIIARGLNDELLNLCLRLLDIQIQTLDIRECPLIIGSCLQQLSHQRSLRELRLNHVAIQAKDNLEALPRIPELSALTMVGGSLTKAKARVFVRCEKLKNIWADRIRPDAKPILEAASSNFEEVEEDGQ